MGLLSRIFGGREGWRLARYEKLVRHIGAREADMRSLSESSLRERAQELRQQAQRRPDQIDALLVDAFATAREAARRTLGLRPYDVQLMGAMALHEGCVAEMKTGEGKTLVATLPAFLNALVGKGVHVVTVNDYLAKRDAKWMGPLYEMLGLTVGVILEDMGRDLEQEQARRRAAYGCDITYGTNHEIAFDYLRDNLARSTAEIVQRGFHYAIVDEVDFLLIDEARTPLIISGPAADDDALCKMARHVVAKLQAGQHFTVEEKTRTASLTDAGLDAVESGLGVPSLTHPDRIGIYHAVHQALLAHAVYHRDVDYVVRDGAVVIVDEFTGRLDVDKRYADGLHQALEAKENVAVRSEDQTLAKITYQTFFGRYAKLAGMTGTAHPERRELGETYGLDVVRVPTHRPMIRRDEPDRVYATRAEKHAAVVDEILALRAASRPVLVGSQSVEESQQLSRRLRKKRIDHHVLNAKNHEKEATIIAQAGRPGAVTISTNMAGRGTDILLGGNADAEGLKEKERAQMHAWCHEQRQNVIAAGGLHVIGTSHHESVRIDDQLRGRAGRQGDPGSSQFLVSLDDALWKRFGKAVIQEIREALIELEHPQGAPIEAADVDRTLRDLQRKVDTENQATRRDVLQYDLVVHAQREAIYAWRMELLGKTQHAFESIIEEVARQTCTLHPEPEDATAALQALLGRTVALPEEARGAELEEAAVSQAMDALDQRWAAQSDPALWLEVGREILLDAIDELWTEHLSELERLEEGIGLMSYAEIDPVVAWRKEATAMWDQLLQRIRRRFVRLWFRVKI